VSDLDRDLPLHGAVPLETAIRESNWSGRISSDILHTISAIALLLAVVGLYGVTAQSVIQRTHEIGIRVALGASSWNVTWLVLRRALTYVGLGLAVGLPLTSAFERMFIDTSGGQTLTGVSTLGPVVAVIVVVAAAACAWPATKAARIQPAGTLRAE
jgi:putative ABC transport system permease protein